jgi:hypothetical protein
LVHLLDLAEQLQHLLADNKLRDHTLLQHNQDTLCGMKVKHMVSTKVGHEI